MNHPVVPVLVGLLVALTAFRWRPDTGRRVAPTGPVDRGATRRPPRLSLRARRAEQRPPSAGAVAAWCDDIARQLRSGTSLTDALATSLPNDPAARRATTSLRRRLGRGRSVLDAVESASLDDEGPNLRLAFSVIAAAAQLGGSPAAAIDRTAGTLRQRAADADERAVHAAQARLSAHVLTVVPIAMLLLLVVTDDGVRDASASTLGWGCIALGLSLNALGTIWMRRIIGPRRIVRRPASPVAPLVIGRRLRPILAVRRRRREAERALPDALDLLVLSIRAGLTPQQAIAELAVHAPESVRDAFALTVHRIERGRPFADALTALPETLGPRTVGLADVIATSDRYGLPLEPVLDQLTTEARDARRRLDQADARKLPVRLAFPLVVCTLPSFVLLAIAPAVIAALSSLGGSAR